MSTRVNRSAHGWIPEFDGMRGVAVGLVLAYHIFRAGEFSAHWPWTPLVQAGWAGVDLFFVLSGFLITGILLRAKGKPNYWWRFFARRMFRIQPTYLLAASMSLVACTVSGMVNAQQLSLFTMTQNWFMGLGHRPISTAEVTWSLAIEEQFYLIWPLVVARCSQRQLAGVCLALICASPFLRVGVDATFGDVAVYFWTITRLDGLFLGALAALVVQEERTPFRKHAVMLAGPLLILLVIGVEGFGICRHTGIAFAGAGYSFLVVCCVTSLMAVYEGAWPHASKILTWKPLAYLGKISYGLYLYQIFAVALAHELAVRLVGDMAQSTAACGVYILLSLVLSLACAWASWRYVEEPFHQLRDRFVP